MYHVRDIMVSKVLMVDESATVSEAAKLMSRHGIGSLVVVPDGSSHRPQHPISEVALITERGILNKVVAQDKPTNIRVSEVCSRSPPNIDAGCSVGEAFELMTKHRIRWLIVADGGQLAGIVSLSDLTNAVRFSSACRLASPHDRDHFRHG